MSEFLIDINPELELPKYELTLCKLNEEPLTSLKNIKDLEYKAFYVGIDELSFNIPLYRMESNGDKVKNEIYDLVEGDHLILLNDMKYFIIHTVVESANEESGEIYKEVQCYSREYELSSKKLVDYKANSRVLYDISNSMLDGLEKGVLNYIFKYITKAWAIGYIDPDVILKNGKDVHRALDFSNSNLLQVFQELQQTFGCIFRFDTVKQKIDIYAIENVMGQHRGLYISDGNFIKDLSKTIKYDEVKTRLYLYGKDNISIQSISPIGQPYIDNFDAYKSTKYMSQELINALNTYQTKVEGYNPDFDPLLISLQEANIVMEDLHNVDHIDDLNQKGLIALERHLSNLQTLIDVKVEELAIIQKQVNMATGEHLTTLYSEKKNIQTVLDGYEIEKYDVNNLITAKKNEINTQQIVIDGIESQIKSLQGELDMSSITNFTEEQIKELDKFIKVETFNDSNYTEHNIQELYDEGKKILARISQPPIQFDMDVADFLSIVECQHVWDKFVEGDIVTIEHQKIGFNFDVRLVGYEHSADGNSLNLKFSNTNSFDDATLYLKDLLEDFKTTGTVVDFNKDKWGQVGEVESRIAKLVDAKLEEARQNILNAVGQKYLHDDSGLWLYKENPDGTLDDAQIRAINSDIVLTDDNFATVKTAISAKDGINAELVKGKLGEFARIEAGQVNVGGDNPLNIIEYIDTEITDTVNNLGDVINNALSDGKLTNIEANSINLALDSVTAESTNLILNATSLEITTEKTNYSTALTTLTSHLNTNWLGKAYPLEITSVQRTAINDLFKDLENKKSILLTKITEVRAIKEIEDKTIVKGALYNGVRIDSESGLVATRSDDTSKTTVNATEGIKIQGKVNGVWQDNFYVDTNGFIRAKNIIIDGLDSGNKTFNTTPTVPYALNDLWKVSGIAGVDFKICTTARATGSYVASDWTNVTNLKEYADTIKNLTSGTSIAGGTTTIDNTKVRVEHTGLGGQYSEIRADGFVRKWQYGDAKYLNGLWGKEYSFDINAPSSSIPSDVKVELPVEFRGRDADIEIILVPTAQNFANASPIGILSNDVFRFYSVSHALKPILKIKSKYLTATIPYINVASYMDTRLMWYDGENINRYYKSSFLVLVVGK